MKPTSSRFLILTALAGAVATGFLVVMLLGSDPAVLRHGGQAGEERPEARADSAAGGADPARRNQTPSRVGGPNSVYTGKRAPRDGPRTEFDRRADQNSVTELINEIMRAENINQRFRIERELKRLLRRLGHNIDPALRQRLVSMIDTVEPKWRRLVGSALGSLQGDKVVAKALMEKLKERPDNRYTRRAIYEALGNLHVKAVIPELVAMLGEGHEDETLLVRTIGQVGGPKEARFLLDRLDGPLRADTRNQIVRVLKEKRGLPGLMDDVAAKLGDATPATKRSLLTVLGSSGDPTHAAAVRELLENETDAQTRRTAIGVLGNFGDPDSGKKLLDLLAHGGDRERKYAAQAISRIRNAETIGMMAENWRTLGNDGKWAIIQAGALIQQPTEKLFELATQEGIHDGQMRLRVASAKLLGKPGKDEHVEALVSFIGRAKHPSEWTHGLQALERIGTKKAAEEALSSLHVVHNKQSREQWMQRFERLLAKAHGDPAARRGTFRRR